MNFKFCIGGFLGVVNDVKWFLGNICFEFLWRFFEFLRVKFNEYCFID